MGQRPVTIMGIFAADLSFRVSRLPKWGETVIGETFTIGSGGKGSNQAIAAARLGGDVHFISKVGDDMFSEIARKAHTAAGVKLDFLFQAQGQSTGAAAIIVDAVTGENAIVVTPGAANMLTTDEIDRAHATIAESACFMTQFELSTSLVEYGIRTARTLGVTTILNPAPAHSCSDDLLALCDYITPNETEASAITGMPVNTFAEVEKAAESLRSRGAGAVIITMGARGAFLLTGSSAEHVPVFNAGAVVETTGAGDAFNGAFACGLAEGMTPLDATRFGCAVAGISVTRPGTSQSMPFRREVEKLIQL